MKNVLFITTLKQQYYYDPFMRACEKRNVAIYIFDPSCFPKEASMCVTMGEDGKISGFIDVQKCMAGGTSKMARLSLKEIHVAWYLRENVVQPNVEKDSLETRFAENESRIALRSLFSVMDCVWVNRRDTMDFLSSNKLYQQFIAQQCGLLVPRTLISNNPQSVADFSDPNNGLLLKTLGCIRLDDKGKYFLYANRFSHKELVESAAAIRVCPVFTQEYIEKCYEYRVMVIGGRVLSCRIDSQASESTKTDWRHYDFDRVEHKQVDLPKDVQQKLLCFMQKVGLQYGAIDLIETPESAFVFLEVNPSGQWGWIADLAGLPIPEAVAEMLELL